MNEFLHLWDLALIGDKSGSLTLGDLITIIVVMICIVIGLRWMRRKLIPKLAQRFGINQGTLHSLALIATYSIGLLSLIFLIQASGVDLQALTIVFGALSVGIGFGLQNVVNNFVCGVVLLFERPVRIGDRVTIDGYEGDIVDIAMRATTLRTNEGVSVIVPNAQFITDNVVNHSLNNRTVRIKIPIIVAYASDPEHVRSTMIAVAEAHPCVLQDPPPIVVFDEFGPHALHFFLWVWTDEYTHLPTVFRSEINFSMHKALQLAGIHVPFQQLDVHLKNA